jgi:hypothetical protein
MRSIISPKELIDLRNAIDEAATNVLTREGYEGTREI